MINFISRKNYTATNLVDSDRTQTSVVDIINASDYEIFVVRKNGPHWIVEECVMPEPEVVVVEEPEKVQKPSLAGVVGTEQPKKFMFEKSKKKE